MLAKRIIPCLDVKDGRTVKGVNFIDLRDAGDPAALAEFYSQQGADELVFLDITATIDKRKTLQQLVRKTAQKINIPFTVGGGINSLEDAYEILQAGADKIAINSAAVKEPELINRLAEKFGSQCIVVAIDAKEIEGKWVVYLAGGSIATQLDLFEWAEESAIRGAGEILFTSINHDGTKSGFAEKALAKLTDNLKIPVIASGGAGKMEHFAAAFQRGKADAALAASVFHFKEIDISVLKQYLRYQGITVRI